MDSILIEEVTTVNAEPEARIIDGAICDVVCGGFGCAGASTGGLGCVGRAAGGGFCAGGASGGGYCGGAGNGGAVCGGACYWRSCLRRSRCWRCYRWCSMLNS